MTDSAETAPEPYDQREQADQAQPPASVPSPRGIASHRPGHALAAKILALLTEAGITAPVAAAALPPEVRDQLLPWAVGFVGEERLGVELAWLDSRWSVLHSVPVGSGGADVDHLLIGPAGVFTVNSKHHPGGRVDVRGEAVFLGTTFKHYVSDARSEARRVRDRLHAQGVDVEVRPLVCVVGAQRLRVIEAPEGVTVLGSEDFIGHLNLLPAVVTPATAEAAFEAARQPGAWPGVAAPPAPDWVVELTRALGAPVLTKAIPKRRAQAVTSQLPRRPGGVTARTRVRPSRPGVSRATSAPRRVLINLAVILAAVFLVPPVLTWTMKGIAEGARAAIPTPSPSSAAPYIAPEDMEAGYPGGDCPTASAQARHPLGNLLICRKNDDGERVWVYADPWLRLRVQTEGVGCTVRGKHARSFWGDRVTLVCARQDDGSLEWAVDPTWKPEA